MPAWARTASTSFGLKRVASYSTVSFSPPGSTLIRKIPYVLYTSARRFMSFSSSGAERVKGSWILVIGSLRKLDGSVQFGQQSGQQELLTVVICGARISWFVGFKPEADQLD